MDKITNLLKSTSHRPFDLPKGQWRWYQEWNDVLFLHWVIPEELITPLIPTRLHLDTFNGQCWISLIAFSMGNVRLNFTPALSMISDFHQINLRTYVVENNQTGIYLLHIEAQKQFSVLIAKILSGLRYEKAIMNRSKKNDLNLYSSLNHSRKFKFETTYISGDPIETKTKLDLWLTERYCLFFDKKEKLYRYEVHHKEWKFNQFTLNNLETKYNFNELSLLNKKPDLFHYSTGVNALAWEKSILKNIH